MKKIYLTLVVLLATINMFAQGWPANYSGVMLQGFYWNSYSESKWTKLEAQAPELGQYFNLVWIPQSAYCGNKSMGYDDLYWFSNYESSFGSESELRSLIKTFKNNGIGTIADVVINHRKNVSTWFDFPVETYKGVTYEMKSTDICANDDGGPIIIPQSGSLCLTPVAPHSLNIRPIVINDTAEIVLDVESRSHNYLVAIDGRSERMTEQTRLIIRKAPHSIKIVKQRNQRYFSTLREKLMWGADQRQR
jgi:hypothetical protein